MKQICQKSLLLLSTIFIIAIAQGQGVAINSTSAAADTSAMLDVSSATKGMLVPRMLSQQRSAIVMPATGLLVYQTDSVAGFYQYNGTGWVHLLADSAAAAGDLAGKYPAPSIAATRAAGRHIVSAINASDSVVNPANLGTGAAGASTFLRGDGTWNTAPAKYIIPMGSGSSRIGLTTAANGATDSIAFVGFGAAGNQLVNVNGGSYIDPNNTYPMVAVPVPLAGTVNSFSFYFRLTTPSLLFLTGTYTFKAQLYYGTPPLYNLIGSETFYPVTGASVNINLNTATGGIGVIGETLDGNVTGLSFPIPAGSRLLIMVSYNVSTTPFTLQTLTGNVTAAVGMQ